VGTQQSFNEHSGFVAKKNPASALHTPHLHLQLQDCGNMDPPTFASPSPSVYEANELANFVSVKRSKQKKKLIVGFSISSRNFVSGICESLRNLQSLFT
jgi:hypothetical protein